MSKRWKKSAIPAILLLAWPTIVEQALQTVVQYVDSAMVGSLGASASAAVGLSTTLNWLINSVFSAMGVGVLACIARAMGAGDTEKAKKTVVQSVIIAIVLGLVMTAITLGLSPYIPGWLGAEPNLQGLASKYFAVICAPMLFRGCSLIFGAALRGARDMKTPMKVNVVMNILNIIGNYLLIYETREVMILGHGITVYGAGMGVTGAGISTAFAYVFGGVMMLYALYKNEALSPAHKKLKVDPAIMKQCITIGVPIMLERITVCLGHVVFTGLVTSLGTVSLAAHTIALTAEEAFYIPGYGFQAAASTLAGNALGEKDFKKLNNISKEIAILTIGIMAITGGALFFFATPVMSVFTNDHEVIRLGSSVLKIVALSEPVFGAVVIFEGVFNGIGDTKAPFVISTVSMWGIRILFTFLCIHVFDGGLNLVWICMVADNVFRGMCLFLRFVTKRYLRNYLDQDEMPEDIVAE